MNTKALAMKHTRSIKVSLSGMENLSIRPYGKDSYEYRLNEFFAFGPAKESLVLSGLELKSLTIQFKD